MWCKVVIIGYGTVLYSFMRCASVYIKQKIRLYKQNHTSTTLRPSTIYDPRQIERFHMGVSNAFHDSGNQSAVDFLAAQPSTPWRRPGYAWPGKRSGKKWWIGWRHVMGPIGGYVRSWNPLGFSRICKRNLWVFCRSHDSLAKCCGSLRVLHLAMWCFPSTLWQWKQYQYQSLDFPLFKVSESNIRISQISAPTAAGRVSVKSTFE